MMRKGFIFIMILSVMIGSAIYGKPLQKITDIYQYNELKIDVGNVYHYITSDIEGKSPMDTFLYVKSKDTIVTYKDYRKILNEVYIITWTFDWDHMMLKHAVAVNPLNNKEFPNIDLSTDAFTDYQKKKYVVNHFRNDMSGKKTNNSRVINLERIPSFDYSFFHFDLQFAMRFLKKGIKSFTIGNVYSRSYNNGTVKYVGDETINGILCQKYYLQMDGILAVIFNSKGYLWLAKDDPRHYAVKYINYQRRNWNWKNFKLELAGIQKMEPKQWDDFVAEKVKEANQELDLKQ